MNMEEYVESSHISYDRNCVDQSEKKLCNIIQTGVNLEADIGIIGIPFDEGVKFSKGRTGARKAPEQIRKQLNKYGTTFNIDYLTDISDLTISDFGNIIINNESPDEVYEKITDVIYNMVKNDVIPLVLGGGHDITYPCIRGFTKQFESIGGLNIDVHFDVREQIDTNISSGMGFRKILESIDTHPLLGKNFVEIGADGNVNSKKYYTYLKNHDVTILPIKFLRDSISENQDIESLIQDAYRIAEEEVDAVFASLDIDCVSSDAAPGCSFINPNGFTTDEISRIAHAIGYNKKVKYFDIVEVNPEFDVDNRTTRLAARIINCFLTGYKQRKQDSIEYE